MKLNLFDESVQWEKGGKAVEQTDSYFVNLHPAQIACPYQSGPEAERKANTFDFLPFSVLKKVVKLTSPLSVNISLFQFSPTSRIPQPDL